MSPAAESVELIDPASSPAPEPDGAAAPAPDGAAISDALFASVPDFDDDPIDLDELGGRSEPESGPQ
ncbi:MAG: hypothetical protein R2710_25265 [Acidimicrobiales bacterium]